MYNLYFVLRGTGFQLKYIKNLNYELNNVSL